MNTILFIDRDEHYARMVNRFLTAHGFAVELARKGPEAVRKARDLQPGMQFHTITGTARVESVQNASVQEPHNLVVADFHTFFASEDKILTHDNTMHRPTNVVVPGLAVTNRLASR